MAALTPEEIFQACVQAGFTPDQAVTWTAIALAESGGRPDAHNPSGEDSWGLFQINIDPDVRENRWGDLTDPVVNARAAFELSHNGTDLRPWTVTHDRNQGTNKDYRNHMEEARAAGGGQYEGNFLGVEGYRGEPSRMPTEAAPDPGPLPTTPEPEAQPAAVDPRQGPDTDQDGLSDPFEMSKGTDPLRADTDLDGLTDGFEMMIGTNALALDSDGDGLSDGYEARLGSNPLLADSDGDGITDDLELVGQRDPFGLAGGGAGGGDMDGDGLVDTDEVRLRTDPNRADSDVDGLGDQEEIDGGFNPLDADTDNDGFVDAMDTSDVPLNPIDPLGGGPLGGDPLGAGDPLGQVAAMTTGGVPGPGFGAVPGPGLFGGAPVPGAPMMPGPAGMPGMPVAPMPPATATPLMAPAPPLPPGPAAAPLDPAAAAALAAPAAPDDGQADQLRKFVDDALSQTGDPYVWASEAQVEDDNPDAFDCSELVQWAAGRVGVDMPDGSWLQYLKLKEQGLIIPVEEAANTPGALLFSFSSEPTPGGGRPSSAHVAISLGDGNTIEARGTRYGVGSWEIGDRFDYAAVLPGFADVTASTEPATTVATAPPLSPTAGPDSDMDGVSDPFEMAQGTDPLRADTDMDGLTDGFEFTLGLDPKLFDTDGDGLSDGYEVRIGLNPLSADTDGDGVTDDLELVSARTPFATAGMAATAGDPDLDGDGLSGALEAAIGTDPNAIDTDLDGLNDDKELAAGTNPLDPDSDDDGFIDGLLDF
jgi:cell wall-associated NlpC family hydrolase